MDSSQNIDGFENPLSEFEGFGRTRRTRTDEATAIINIQEIILPTLLFLPTLLLKVMICTY